MKVNARTDKRAMCRSRCCALDRDNATMSYEYRQVMVDGAARLQLSHCVVPRGRATLPPSI
jgi:hypothetical protein